MISTVVGRIAAEFVNTAQRLAWAVRLACSGGLIFKHSSSFILTPTPTLTLTLIHLHRDFPNPSRESAFFIAIFLTLGRESAFFIAISITLGHEPSVEWRSVTFRDICVISIMMLAKIKVSTFSLLFQHTIYTRVNGPTKWNLRVISTAVGLITRVYIVCWNPSNCLIYSC